MIIYIYMSSYPVNSPIPRKSPILIFITHSDRQKPRFGAPSDQIEDLQHTTP